ncbi:MAG: di-trans,poly-cis-decaprenylcistransferase [Gammaproteobacteria bacterium]|nr:di-trans,poly-cis-decaprenylcistransferase [Gammaproteobacteria bacterium]
MPHLPRHIAIIMDGNGRWAKQRGLPRYRGHKAGSEAARRVIDLCAKQDIKFLTLWAFGIENWRRPANEVRYLMNLFYRVLRKNMVELHKNSVRLTVIGSRENLSKKLVQVIDEAEELTRNNDRLCLNVAFNYSGRWDILSGLKKSLQAIQAGDLDIDAVDEEYFRQQLCLSGQPEPDLFIRTSGELRISNFILWQLAYAELYFTDVFWPDFGEEQFTEALQVFADRERRFGGLSEK